jgi:carboxymethylenebutenolidase
MSAISWTRADGTVVPGLSFGAPDASVAVVAIQEWWGVDFEIKTHAAKIAADLGVRVLVPDLYRGKLGSEAEEAQHLMSSLDFPGAVQDVIGAAAFLRANGAKKVGVTGFCMGGALTVGSAAHGGPASFDCCAPFCESQLRKTPTPFTSPNLCNPP